MTFTKTQAKMLVVNGKVGLGITGGNKHEEPVSSPIQMMYIIQAYNQTEDEERMKDLMAQKEVSFNNLSQSISLSLENKKYNHLTYLNDCLHDVMFSKSLGYSQCTDPEQKRSKLK